MKNLLIISLALLASGCIGVPSTKINLQTGSITLPKNHTAKNIDIQIEKDGTVFKVKADYITSKNDPNVIGASAEGQVDIINAHYKGTQGLVDQAIKASAKTP